MFTFDMKIIKEQEGIPTIFTQNSLLNNIKNDSENDDIEKRNSFSKLMKQRTEIANFGEKCSKSKDLFKRLEFINRHQEYYSY